MRSLKTITAGFLLLTAVCSQAAYQVEITFNNGVVRKLDNLTVQSGGVVLAAENINVPFSQIKSAVFSFAGLTPADCELLMKRGAYEELAVRLNEALDPVKQGLGLPGNIDVYAQYKMRACFWIRRFDEAQDVIRTLQSNNSRFAALAGLYSVLIQIEQNQLEEAARTFQLVRDPDSISAAVSEFVRGRLAMDKREYEAALKSFSNILVFHSRDPEWAPAATFYEGLVYKKTGYLESASNVVSELTIAYPDAYWGRRAGELK